MEARDIAAVVAISAFISGVISLSLQAYFQAKFKAEFDDRFKSLEQRKRLLVKASELIYRIRNKAEEISKQANINSNGIDDLTERIKDLREYLFKNKYELEIFDIFNPIHEFVRYSENFKMRYLDILEFLKNRNTERAHDSIKKLQFQYETIDEKYLLFFKNVVNKP